MIITNLDEHKEAHILIKYRDYEALVILNPLQVQEFKDTIDYMQVDVNFLVHGWSLALPSLKIIKD